MRGHSTEDIGQLKGPQIFIFWNTNMLFLDQKIQRLSDRISERDEDVFEVLGGLRGLKIKPNEL